MDSWSFQVFNSINICTKLSKPWIHDINYYIIIGQYKTKLCLQGEAKVNTNCTTVNKNMWVMSETCKKSSFTLKPICSPT